MWLWLLTLLFDPTVTMENTRCLTISEFRRTAAPLLAVVTPTLWHHLATFGIMGVKKIVFLVNHTALHQCLSILYAWIRMLWSSYVPLSLFTSLTITIIILLCFTEREPTAKGVEVIQWGTTLGLPDFFLTSLGNSWNMSGVQWTARRVQLFTSRMKLR